ncbi:MAG: HDIG domain-containing protein, partial [Bacteroidetes bacterium]|nr:HDIG domain-containing protein [Bacteroidota bacterium]
YGQNMVKHTLEETQMGVKLAKELGVDIVATKLACLLHDIGKVITDKEGNHMDLGADYIKKLGMPEVVVNAVRESHDDKPSNMVGVIVQIVDSISGARPGARYEDYENFVERMQKLEDVSMQFEGVHKAYAISAGREVRVIVEPEKIDDAKVEKLSNDIAQKIAQIQDFPGIVKVTVIREKRAFAYTTGSNYISFT